MITEQAKLRNPVRDWTSRKVTFFLLRKSDIMPIHLSTLSSGKQASIKQESSSRPELPVDVMDQEQKVAVKLNVKLEAVEEQGCW